MSSTDDFSENDIAIVGMALRVPGASNLQEFWTNLHDGVESIRTVSNDELIEAGEKPENIRKKNYVPRTGDLPNLEMFDADFFGLSPKEAAIMDPQHRHFLECSWEAMEDACRTPQHMDGPIGVFAGCGMGSYFYFNVCSHKGLVDETGLFLLRHTGNDKDFLATRASFIFNLQGPSVNVQTACSTSLVAVHYACQSLLSGECDMALAGGCTIEFPHRVGYLYQDGEVLSPDGHCRAFDHRAAGTVFGSGTGVVALRRLSDALADGDPIRAVIKSTAVNNDGASKAGYLAPSVSGQAAAIVEAHAIADISADSIQYVECHGTGTYLGDPIEIEALTQAFRQTTQETSFCRIGSVKTNIGHLDTAAGVVSLIKAALSIENETIPPTLNYESPNPAINFAESPFIVNDTLTKWPETNGPRRAAINSLGVGGTNAHAVIQEAPKQRQAAQSAAESPNPQILIMSAQSAKALEDTPIRFANFLTKNGDVPLQDVAYSLLHGRQKFEHFWIAAVENREKAIELLTQNDPKSFGTQQAIENLTGPAFLFPGGSSQYPGMAQSLYENEPSFRATIDEGLGYLTPEAATEIRKHWLEDESPEAAEKLTITALQLPAILITEIALARLLASWGLEPSIMVGHSLGENAAACIAGVLSFENAVELARKRGELVDEIEGGGVLSVATSIEELQKHLPDTLDIASVNAPELCVVSGPTEELSAFQQTLNEAEIETNRLPLNVPAHSRMFEPILARFEEFVSNIPLSVPQIPIVSNLTGELLTAEQATDPQYWTKHLRSTVRFADCLKTVTDQGNYYYLEVGPGRVLSSLAKAQGTIPTTNVANCLPHPDEETDDRLHFLTTIGKAWAAGLEAKIDKQWEGSTPKRIALPTYAFQHFPYFLEKVEQTGTQNAAELPPRLEDIKDWGWQPVWRQSVPDARLGADQTPTSWVIFLGPSEFGKTLASKLEAAGHSVKTVTTGDAYAKISQNAYTVCDEDGRPSYDSLIKDLIEDGGVPDRILHMGLVTSDEKCRAGSSFFHRNQEAGFYSLFYLGQVLADADLEQNIQITVLSNGMQRVGDEALPYPEKATILGPVQVLPRELPNLFVRSIDLPIQKQSALSDVVDKLDLKFGVAATSQSAIIDRLWDDLFAEHGNEVVAYRNDRRWKRSQEKLALENAEKGATYFRKKGTYILTGGLGDLGSIFATELARKFQAKLVLMGRTELPERENWDNYLSSYSSTDRIGRAIKHIQKIEDAGGEVFYANADVTDEKAVKDIVAEAKKRFGKINGLLHIAGTVKDDFIQLKDPFEIHEVFAPKVMGTTVLADALADEPLDIIVLFSSTSTDTAPAGQVDYVAANAFLNAFAESQTYSKDITPRIAAVHWGIWKDVGMAARSIEQAEQGSETPTSVSMIGHHLFDRRLKSADGGETLEGRWDAKRHWILDEHRLSTGEAIWPGTGYIEVISQALHVLGITGAYEISDLTFLRPLYVPENDSRIARITLNRVGAGRFGVQIESKPVASENGAWTTHASATVRPYHNAKADTKDVDALTSACTKQITHADNEPLRSAQEDHLNFGPRWRVLQSLHMGEDQAVAKLAVDDKFAEDFDNPAATILHPALLDIATGYAMDLIPGYDPQKNLWVPMSYGTIRIFKPLTQKIWSNVRLNKENDLGDGYAMFDVTLLDESGSVIAEIEKFTITRLEQDANLAASLKQDQETNVVSAPQTQELSPALARLAAQVEQGIGPEDGLEALLNALGTGLPQVIVSSMDLPSLQRSVAYIEEETDTGVAFERPTLDTEFVSPRNDVEEQLAAFWSELLGVQKIGIHDNFFDLGGHSLIAVRLFRLIKKKYAVDFPISVLFDAPTIAACAELLQKSGAGGTKDTGDAPKDQAEDDTKFVHVVKMHPGKNPNETPLFIVAGMFGNILNLRHLAMQLGQDRPVYGLQARGLYGDHDPHETFEEAARDYIEEIKQIEPEGPYLLAGFSGGGLIAYEMAQQLTQQGKFVPLLTMLDTPYPERVELSLRDRIAIRTQDIQREGPGFLIRYIKWRIEWERQRLREQNSENAEAEQFHSQKVQEAFMRALWRYQGKPYDGRILQLRPKLRIAYHLPDGRVLNPDREPVNADNNWSRFVSNMSVVEVPGDHDAMVLEPNVRVLARYMRKALNEGEWGSFSNIAAE